MVLAVSSILKLAYWPECRSARYEGIGMFCLKAELGPGGLQVESQTAEKKQVV